MLSHAVSFSIVFIQITSLAGLNAVLFASLAQASLALLFVIRELLNVPGKPFFSLIMFVLSCCHRFLCRLSHKNLEEEKNILKEIEGLGNC